MIEPRCSLCGCPGAHFCTGKPGSTTPEQWSLPAQKVYTKTPQGPKEVHRIPLLNIFPTEL